MTQGYLDTNGVRLWYERLGPARGKPVILIMGVGASAIWWPSTFIDVLVNGGCQVVSFDNRDIGLSTHIDFTARPYRVEDMVNDTLGLMKSLGVDSANLVGMSLGGIICQQLALQRPECVRSLSLISTTPGPDDCLTKTNKKILSKASAPPEDDEEWVGSIVALCRALAGSRFAFDEDRIRKQARADMERGTNIRSNHVRLPQLLSRVHRLGEIDVPTVVVHGSDDPLIPLEHAQVLARGIASARLIEWDRVGHEIPLQLAAELGSLVLEVVR